MGGLEHRCGGCVYIEGSLSGTAQSLPKQPLLPLCILLYMGIILTVETRKPLWALLRSLNIQLSLWIIAGW